METYLAVAIAILIVLIVFVTSLCCAILKRARNRRKIVAIPGAVYSNQLTSLSISNTSLGQTDPSRIDVFHINLNRTSNESSPSNCDKSQDVQLPPPSYDEVIKTQLPTVNPYLHV